VNQSKRTDIAPYMSQAKHVNLCLAARWCLPAAASKQNLKLKAKTVEIISYTVNTII